MSRPHPLLRRCLPLALATLVTTASIAPLTACSRQKPAERQVSTENAGPAADFKLSSYDGTEVTLAGLLERGPAVLVFYRGHW